MVYSHIEEATKYRACGLAEDGARRISIDCCSIHELPVAINDDEGCIASDTLRTVENRLQPMRTASNPSLPGGRLIGKVVAERSLRWTKRPPIQPKMQSRGNDCAGIGSGELRCVNHCRYTGHISSISTVIVESCSG